MLTEKENYLRILRGEIPEWIPSYSFDPSPFGPVPNIKTMPEIVCQFRINGGGKDVWGVNWVATESTAGALVPDPDPNTLVLKDMEDLEHWRDFIKAPDISNIDWEAMYQRDMKRLKFNREESVMGLNLHVGYFQQLIGFLGFENAVMALYEYPDEIHEILEYMCDFYTAVTEKVIDIYNPEVIEQEDDTAAWGAPFISPAMYRDFLIPVYRRQAQPGLDRGKFFTMHNCGKAECFIDDLVNIGVCQWDPAQTCNDLDAVRAKYGNKLVIAGGWDARGRLLEADCTDEEIYESVRESINRLAPIGGYLFCGGFLGSSDGMDECIRRNIVVQTAVKEIGRDFYKH